MNLSEQDIEEMEDKIKELMNVIAKPLHIFMYNNPSIKNFYKVNFVEEDGEEGFSIIVKKQKYNRSIKCPCCEFQILDCKEE